MADPRYSLHPFSVRPAGRYRGAGRRKIRGAVALEYILISALVAIALIGAFRMFGQVVAALFQNMIWSSGGAIHEIVS